MRSRRRVLRFRKSKLSKAKRKASRINFKTLHSKIPRSNIWDNAYVFFFVPPILLLTEALCCCRHSYRTYGRYTSRRTKRYSSLKSYPLNALRSLLVFRVLRRLNSLTRRLRNGRKMRLTQFSILSLPLGVTNLVPTNPRASLGGRMRTRRAVPSLKRTGRSRSREKGKNRRRFVRPEDNVQCC